MQISIFPASLESDSKRIIETLHRVLDTPADSCRFDWLYLDCPYGRGRAWLARDVASDRIVGVAAAFPRRFYFGKELGCSGVLGDFCFDPQYRSLGPALQLQRACLSVLENDQDAFCYDFPSASMVSVYKRLGFGVTGQMVRLAKPLRVDRKLKRVIRNRVLLQAVSFVGNTILSWNSPRVEADRSLKLSVLQGRCGEEFTTLAEEQRGKFGICLERSAAYLNWRYVENPLARHEIVTARRDGHLLGYIIWTRTKDDASIVDLFGQKDRIMVQRLIAEVTHIARERGVESLSVSMNEAHLWLPLFLAMGFHRRDSSPVMIIPSKTFPCKLDSHLSGWYLMHGDRDS